jgi:hypothetical protein
MEILSQHHILKSIHALSVSVGTLQTGYPHIQASSQDM